MRDHIRLFVISLALACFLVVGAKASSADSHEGAAADNGVGVAFDAKARASALFATGDVSEFNLDNARLGATFSKSVFDARVSVQTDGNSLDILDAYLAVPLYKDYANFKVGRLLIPAGRNAMLDIYGWTEWQGASLIAKWSSLDGYGRRDGASVSGSTDVEGQVSVDYNFGLFNGDNDDVLFAGRVDLGIAAVDGLSIGSAVQVQDGYLGVGVDATYSRAIPYGLLAVDAAFNHYDLDDQPYVPGVGLNAGNGFTVGTSYLLDGTIPVIPFALQPQPFFRYQRFEYADGVSGSEDRFDAGANILVSDLAQTKLTVNYFHTESVTGEDADGGFIGFQFAF